MNPTKTFEVTLSYEDENETLVTVTKKYHAKASWMLHALVDAAFPGKHAEIEKVEEQEPDFSDYSHQNGGDIVML